MKKIIFELPDNVSAMTITLIKTITLSEVGIGTSVFGTEDLTDGRTFKLLEDDETV